MVSCCVLKCDNNSRNDQIRWFKLPKFTHQTPLKSLNIQQRMKNKQFTAWVKVINRTEITEEARVCSAHFAAGEAARWSDTKNKDWLPHLNMGYECDARIFQILRDVIGNPISANTEESKSHDLSMIHNDCEEQEDVLNDKDEEHNLHLVYPRRRLTSNNSLTMNTGQKASNSGKGRSIRQQDKRYYKRGTRHIVPFIENGVPVSFEITELEEIRIRSNKTEKLKIHKNKNGSTIYVCKICKNQFQSETEAIKHVNCSH